MERKSGKERKSAGGKEVWKINLKEQEKRLREGKEEKKLEEKKEGWKEKEQKENEENYRKMSWNKKEE